MDNFYIKLFITAQILFCCAEMVQYHANKLFIDLQMSKMSGTDSIWGFLTLRNNNVPWAPWHVSSSMN